MSYQEQKEAAKKKSKRIHAILLAVFLFLAAGICIFSAFVPAATWRYYVKLPKVSRRGAGELRLHMIDVGQGDSFVIEFPDGQVMLIDGGDGREETSSVILRYLNALDVKRLDYLLLTHPDSDHCGALDKVLKYKKPRIVYAPSIEDYDINGEYAEFYAALRRSDATCIVSRRYLQILSKSAEYPYSLTFLSPYSLETPDNQYDEVNDGKYTDTDVNNVSAVFWLDYFGVDALFTGDATSDIEDLLMRDYDLGMFDFCNVNLKSTEILKVAHHGSSYSTSADFVRFLGVETALVSCGKNNTYGHPSSEALSALQGAGAEIYRTDLGGNTVVTMRADGSYSVKNQNK